MFSAGTSPANCSLGMGKSQKWITCLDPEYLLNKYCGVDKVEQRIGPNEDYEEKSYNIWTKWKTGLVQGDPFEERAVVLDSASLPFAKSMIDLVQTRKSLKEHFLLQLRQALSSAAGNAEPGPVLILAFCHGDFETGGLLVGITHLAHPESRVSIVDIASILAEYPHVPVTLFLTSCYSGHWVLLTEELRGSPPTVTAAPLVEQDSFGFAWSSSLRHAGGVFSRASLHELLKEPHYEEIRTGLPDDALPHTARTYESITRAVLSEAHRLCLPDNTPLFGSTPIFTAAGAQDKFWKRTGYSRQDYKSNYDNLAKIPPSDPHPKFDRKTVSEGIIDDDDPRVIEWEKRNPDLMRLFKDSVDYAEVTGGYGTTMRGLNSTTNLMFLISQYISSKPESNESSSGIYVKGLIAQFRLGHITPENSWDLRRLLVSRLQMNELADIFAKKLGLNKLPPIAQWELKHQKLHGGHHPEASKIMKLVIESKIFSRPAGKSGMLGPGYLKPVMYLAYAMLESNKNAEDAKDLIAHIDGLRNRPDAMAKKWIKTGDAQKSLKRLHDVVDEAWKESKHRQKRARPSLQSTGWIGDVSKK